MKFAYAAHINGVVGILCSAAEKRSSFQRVAVTSREAAGPASEMRARRSVSCYLAFKIVTVLS